MIDENEVILPMVKEQNNEVSDSECDYKKVCENANRCIVSAIAIAIVLREIEQIVDYPFEIFNNWITPRETSSPERNVHRSRSRPC